MARTIRLTLEVSPQLNETLDRLAADAHTSKSDILRRSIALIEVAMGAKREGKKVGIAHPGQELLTEFVGF